MEDDKVLNEDSLPEPENNRGYDGSEVNRDKAQDTTSENDLQKKREISGFLRAFLFVLISVASFVILFLFIIYIVPVLRESAKVDKTSVTVLKNLKQDANYKKQIGLVSKDIQRLSRKYNSYTTGQSYIVVNTIDNKFFLYKNKMLVREGSCSTGKLLNLKTEKGRSWVFKTPKGKRSIQGKRTNPAWHKPDWAFIEEGEPVPPKDSPLRWEANVLGDYALDIGDSYMIHGTIYKRQLGMPVTHGCVRLNDEDLEVVYNTLNIGSKVYIF